MAKNQNNSSYNRLLHSRTGEKWNRIGIRKRAGVCVPLFSAYSSKSIGTGEIPDIRLLIDWCKKSGLSILQLLPLNELGYDFSPYNAISTFALEPMYLSISKLKDTDTKIFRRDIKELAKTFPPGAQFINKDVKAAKTALMRKIFENSEKNSAEFIEFKERNMHWLKYYSLFRVLTDMNNGKEWVDWDIMDKYLSPAVMQKINVTKSEELEFFCWLQWQLFEQLKDAAAYARKKGILIMGDLPFLVARNSADVWAYKNYFKLHLSSGAPPDMYFAKGQKWGMPPYDWENIRTDNYSYVSARLKYAENFYDLYRIDHFVGLFRLWTVRAEDTGASGITEGGFDPPYEQLWGEHGKEIINIMNESTTMLPCAEDLGTVPDCSDPILLEYGIPGMNVQRWEKMWGGLNTFLPAHNYRENSNAVISTHDSSSFPDWFEREAGTIDKTAFKMICEKKGFSDERTEKLMKELFEIRNGNENKLHWRPEISNVYMIVQKSETGYTEIQDIISMYLSTYNEKNTFLNYIGHKTNSEKSTPSLIRKNLNKIFETKSIFSIQLLMEYLFLDRKILNKNKYFRINTPGTISDLNWSAVIPISLDELLKSNLNEQVKKLVDSSGR